MTNEGHEIKKLHAFAGVTGNGVSDNFILGGIPNAQIFQKYQKKCCRRSMAE